MLDLGFNKLWIPILNSIGFHEFEINNKDNEIIESNNKRFIIKHRNEYKYSIEKLSIYKKEFIITYCHNNGERSPFDKLFIHGLKRNIDFYCYAWISRNKFSDFVIFNVKELEKIYERGKFGEYIQNNLKIDNENNLVFIHIPINELLEFTISNELIVKSSLIQ